MCLLPEGFHKRFFYLFLQNEKQIDERGKRRVLGILKTPLKNNLDLRQAKPFYF